MVRLVNFFNNVLSLQKLAILAVLICLNSFCIAQSTVSYESTLSDTVKTFEDYKDTAMGGHQLHLSSLPYFNSDKDSSIKESLNPINRTKMWIIVGGTALTLGASYYYANNAWWKGAKSSFHMDRDTKSGSIFSVLHGPDEKYAKNIDKLAHFWGGTIYSDLISYMLRDANVPAKRAGLYGALGGMAIQTFIEMKDGYAPRWGFSVLDVTFGTLGSFYAYSQNYIPVFAATDIKISYYKRYDYYFKAPQANAHPTWDEDYMNMNFWATYNPYRLMRHGEHVHPNWPKWLGISVGAGVDQTLDGYYTGQNLETNKGKGNHQLYIAPDIDFTGIFPKSKFFHSLAMVFNRVKFPMPTFRIAPDLKFFPLYF